MPGDRCQEGMYCCLISLQKSHPHSRALTYVRVKAESYCCAHMQIHTYILLLIHIERVLHIIQEQGYDTHMWRCYHSGFMQEVSCCTYMEGYFCCTCMQQSFWSVSMQEGSNTLASIIKTADVMLSIYIGMLLHAYMLELKCFTFMTKSNWYVYM